MAPPDQNRERRLTIGGRYPNDASSLLFSNSRLMDVGSGPSGVVVDALRINTVGMTFGQVISGGHEVALEDPDCVTVLIPKLGHILMDIEGKELCIRTGALAVVEAERRRTRVVPAKDGLFVATTVLVPRDLFRSMIGEGSTAAGRSLTHEIDTPIGRQLRLLLPDLAGDLFRQRDRLLSPRARDELVGLIGDLMADLGGQHSATFRRGGGITEFRRVSQACDIIHGRFDEALSLASLAAELEVTPRWLQVSFKAVHGMSPRDYLQRVRLEQARTQILSSGDGGSVTRAAMDCGFLHLGRFSQAYRRAFGELPSETIERNGGRRSLA